MTSLSYTYPLSQISNVIAWWLPWITTPPAPFGNALEIEGNTITVQTFVLVPNTTDVVAKLNQQAAFAASTGCAGPRLKLGLGLGFLLHMLRPWGALALAAAVITARASKHGGLDTILFDRRVSACCCCIAPRPLKTSAVRAKR